MAIKKIKYIKGKGWFVNNKQVDDGYIAYDTQADVKTRYNADGTVTRLVNGKDFEDDYRRHKREHEITRQYVDKYNNNRYGSKLINQPRLAAARLMSVISPKLSQPIYDAQERYDKALDKRLSIEEAKAKENLNITHPIDYKSLELSEAYENTLVRAKTHPNIAKLHQWALKHKTAITNEKTYRVRDPQSPDNYTIYDAGVPIYTNKNLIKDALKAGKDEGVSDAEVLSILLGETNFGTNFNWVNNYNKNHNQPTQSKDMPQSWAVNNHQYQSGADYPVIQELLALNKTDGSYGEYPTLYNWQDAYKDDVTTGRTKRLIEQSDSIFRNRAPSALHSMFRRYKKDPNSINLYNASVDKYGRTYQEKVNDNAKRLRPYLEEIKGLQTVNIKK